MLAAADRIYAACRHPGQHQEEGKHRQAAYAIFVMLPQRDGLYQAREARAPTMVRTGGA